VVHLFVVIKNGLFRVWALVVYDFVKMTSEKKVWVKHSSCTSNHFDFLQVLELKRMLITSF